MQKINLFLLSFFIFCIPILYTQEVDHLKRDEIQEIMQHIFSQHIEKKVISGEIVKNSYKVYLEQFDPLKIYLLKSEIAPYLDMSASQAELLDTEYKNNDFSSYEQLNNLVQTAIERSREYRTRIEANPNDIVSEALSTPFIQFDQHAEYPANEKELYERIKQNLIAFFQREITHFGEKGVKGYEVHALGLYERQIRGFEDQYTYHNEQGLAMSPQAQENIFTMHVLKALAKSLDAHTAYFDSNEAYDMRIRLEKGFEGVGIVFQEGPQGIIVTHLIESGPAYKQGTIKIGDLLLEIDGNSIEGKSFTEVMDLLRGEDGEPVHFLFERGKDKNGKKIEISINREMIMLDEDRVDVAKEQFGNGIIARLTLHSFYQNDNGVTSEKDLRQAIKELDKEGKLKGLILDLRENSGGFLSQAVKVAGLFITNGVIVTSKYSNGEEKIYRDMDPQDFYKGPLIILTSRATASAAEIVAQALQDYGVALVVGDEQTYGKGTIQSQTVTDNKGSSFFKVTVGTYYTVSGKTPQVTGVKADVVVPGPYAQFHLGEEYLDHISNGQKTIAPAFKDPLVDIDPALKPWYLHYYTPTLQHRTKIWKSMIPELQKNSSYRITHNNNYQLFLNRFNPHSTMALKKELDEERRKETNFGNNDLQLAETMNVLKDMIYLEAKGRQKEYMVGSEKKAEISPK